MSWQTLLTALTIAARCPIPKFILMVRVPARPGYFNAQYAKERLRTTSRGFLRDVVTGNSGCGTQKV
jgi:hypothetical protein